MILLIIFAFVAGIVTILSPCILPILPIILSSTVGGKGAGKSRPIGVVLGFILSFTFFTLFLSTIVRISGISADSLRFISIIIIAGFGISLLIPKFQYFLEIMFSKLSGHIPRANTKNGFGGGMIVGFSLGLLWTPCVGPILASVISLAITGTVTFDAFLITFAYSLGTAIPMFLIMLGGRGIFQKVPWLLKNTSTIQKIFGIIMILTAIGIYFNIDRKFQTFILNTFPNYGAGLTKIEDNQAVREQLNLIEKDKSRNNSEKTTVDFPKGTKAPEIISGGEWINSEALGLEQLKGRVVIIDFWTYSCINCQRTLPFLKSWWEKYNESGLVIIGVHSPEFEFEKNLSNVKKAVQDFGIKYPVVQDNQFSTWKAYQNQYWPAKYILDKDGYIRYTHFGEGAYDETEKVIQDLLKESGASDVTKEIGNIENENFAKTPETYLGYSRIANFSSNEKILKDQEASYTNPTALSNNEFAYVGKWFVASEYANPKKGAVLYLNFESKYVFLVMRPKKDSSRMKVTVDGKVQFLGKDVKDGIVEINSDKLYELVNMSTPGRHLLKLEFLDDNSEIFAFTFG